MSNLCKRIAKVKKPCARKRRQAMHRKCMECQKPNCVDCEIQEKIKRLEL